MNHQLNIRYNIYMKKLPTFENVKSIKKYMNDEGIALHFVATEDFAYHNKKEVFINKYLDENVITFIIVHELAHIVARTNPINNFSVKFENADKDAIEALKNMHNNDKNSFSFKKLMKYYYFHKLSGKY